MISSISFIEHFPVFFSTFLSLSFMNFVNFMSDSVSSEKKKLLITFSSIRLYQCGAGHKDVMD